METLEDEDDFRTKFTQHLQIALRDNPYLNSVVELVSTHISNTPDALRVHISNEAQTLLSEAAKSEHAHIIRIRHLGGQSFQINGITYGGSTSRENALWESALSQLLDFGFVSQVGSSVFRVTRDGFLAADELGVAGTDRSKSES